VIRAKQYRHLGVNHAAEANEKVLKDLEREDAGEKVDWFERTETYSPGPPSWQRVWKSADTVKENQGLLVGE
jgi:hypothetical protein